MIPALQFLSILCTGLFAGAAVYINMAEHPARMAGDMRSALMQWAPSYRRATLMQAPLAVVAFLASGITWLLGAAMAWLIAGLLIGAVVPFTLIIIMPTNRALLAINPEAASADARSLLDRWGRLHAVRTVLSLLALILMLWQRCG